MAIVMGRVNCLPEIYHRLKADAEHSPCSADRVPSRTSAAAISPYLFPYIAIPIPNPIAIATSLASPPAADFPDPVERRSFARRYMLNKHLGTSWLIELSLMPEFEIRVSVFVAIATATGFPLNHPLLAAFVAFSIGIRNGDYLPRLCPSHPIYINIIASLIKCKY